MVGLGGVQRVDAITQTDPIFVGHGAAYGVLGGVTLWPES